jgi:uncharacterized protein YceH (UPF0502 family)
MPHQPTHIQTEDKSYIREVHSKGLLCTDTAALTRHRKKLAEASARVQMSQRFEHLEERVNDLADLMRQVLAKLSL